MIRIPLIDGDMLLYEIGFAAEYGWQTEGEIPPFDYVKDLLDGRIDTICMEAGATESPVLFFTGSTNFRDDIARQKEYKGNRKESKKPWHFNNILVYLKGKHKWLMEEGLEADDLMAMWQSDDCTNVAYEDGFVPPEFCNTIICTRDKDLRQVPGWHYSWECGKQPSWGPFFVEGFGEIHLEKKKNGNKLSGHGPAFFYAQLLMGDPTDNIPGLPKYGPVKVYGLLEHILDEESAYVVCKEAYRDVYGEDWYKELMEQAYLVWMVREVEDKGQPIMWRPPNETE